MRADRLLSLLMLLQSRGQMTAQQLAGELEVSERTIYRDIDALSIAGVPVYAERGPGGGCALLDSYRTNLTGLTEDEVRALFMLSVPAPLAELGVSQELKGALLKLSAALPQTRIYEKELSRQRIHLDSSWWFQAQEPVPYLKKIQHAVWQDRKLLITYRYPSIFQAQVERMVDPYGLVAKTNVWYLVGARDGLMRVYRVSRVQDAQLSEETFERPNDFDLVTFWREHCVEFEENRASYPVTVRVALDFIPHLPHYFGEAVRDKIIEPGLLDDGTWITITLPFETLEDARERILGFGRAVEVLEPEALRKSVADFAAQTLSLYQT